MCAVSMIYDYGRNNPPWYDPDAYRVRPFPPPPQLPDDQAKKSIEKYLDLIEKAKEFDRVTKQRDCEDPEKAKFMREVLDRLDAIEKRLAAKQ